MTLDENIALLRAAAVENPAEDAPRLIYADALDERGSKGDRCHARLIRRMIALEVEYGPGWHVLRRNRPFNDWVGGRLRRGFRRFAGGIEFENRTPPRPRAHATRVHGVRVSPRWYSAPYVDFARGFPDRVCSELYELLMWNLAEIAARNPVREVEVRRERSLYSLHCVSVALGVPDVRAVRNVELAALLRRRLNIPDRVAIVFAAER